MKIYILLLFCLMPKVIWACSGPLKGFGFKTQDELIAKTNHIVLAEFTGENFIIREVLKSNSSAIIDNELARFYRITVRLNKRNKENHVSNDFEAHSNREFWHRTSTRINWSAGACAPSFTFQVNESYLLFLDSPANPYAAEIIKSKSDKWYGYVLKKLKTN